MSRISTLHTRYEEEIALLRDRGDWLWLALVLAAIVAMPFALEDFWLSVLTFTAISAIAAIGLNLLTGFTGQVSLGHAFFLGLGAYTAAYLGGDLGLPVLVWLPAAGIFGALAGVLIGPFALRLKGLYLAIVTLGLVFLGDYLFSNLRAITGGPQGRAIPSPRIGSLNFADLGSSLGLPLSREQSFFLFVVPLLILAVVVAKNIVRTRTGRAFQAIRDREIAAAIIGVDVARYKIAAFALSSFYAAAAGALLGSYLRHVTPGSFDLFVSVQFVAMIIVGGVGTIYGSVFGALFIVLIPRVVERISPMLPMVDQSGSGAGITVFTLNQLIFGLLIVVFLVVEPTGLAGIWARARLYFRTWPFSY
ncbi:MAG: branched-chain amino acid ABC transporter permease [Chloroflexota bacterium]|nr:branched-chain amino acid ABC transporter permease [Chloroflexota bacterium]